MNTQLDWDDLKVILAIDRAGALAGACRTLNVSHATVYRRLGEIERRLGAELFERSRKGYAATAAGEEAVDLAARIDTDVRSLETRIAGRDLRPSGPVTLTTTDMLLHFLLPDALATFCDTYPEIDVEIVASDNLFDLSLREAEVALRPAAAPPDHLVGRRVGTVAMAIYGHRDLLGGCETDWRHAPLPWIGPAAVMPYAQLGTFMSRHGLDERCRVRASSILGMHSAVKSGIGLGVLPRYAADGDGDLIRCGDAPELDVDLWLLTHPALRNAARVRALTGFLGDVLKDTI